MCMEDVRINRETIVFRYRLTGPANGSVQVLQGAPDRISLFIPSDGAGTTLAADTVDLGGTTDGCINLAYQNLRLTLYTDGNLVTFPWFVMNSSGTQTVVTVFETRLRAQ